FPYIISGDISGAIRVWPVPQPAVRTVLRSPSRLSVSMLVANDGPMVATSVDSSLRWATLEGGAGALPGHAPVHMAMTVSHAEPRSAVYRYDASIELWSFAGAPSQQLVATDHDSVTAVRFLGDERSFVSAGRDGRVVRWAPDASSHHEIGRIPEAIER